MSRKYVFTVNYGYVGEINFDPSNLLNVNLTRIKIFSYVREHDQDLAEFIREYLNVCVKSCHQDLCAMEMLASADAATASAISAKFNLIAFSIIED